MAKATDFLADTVSPHEEALPTAAGGPRAGSLASDYLRDVTSPHEINLNRPTGEIRNLPPQYEGIWRYPEMLAGKGIEGLAYGLGMPGNVEQSIFPSEKPLFPTSAQLLEGPGRAGLTMRSDLTPEGWEKYPAAAVKGGVAGATWAGSSPWTMLATGAMSGLTTQGALDMGFPAPLAEAAGSAVGLGSSLAMTVPRSAMTEARKDFESAGMPVRSAALTTDKRRLSRSLAPSAPFEATENDLGDAIERVAGRLGTSRNWSEAGTKVQNIVRPWLNPVKDADGNVPANSFLGLERAGWKPFDDRMPPTTLTPQPAFENLVREMNQTGGVNRDLIAETQPDILGRWDAILKRRGPTGMGGIDATGAWPVAKTPTIEDATQLRSAIGDMMARPSIIAQGHKDALDALYAALTDDIKQTAIRVGALPEFEAALQNSNELRNFKDQVLSKITHSDTGNRENIFPDVAAKAMLNPLKSGDTSFSLLRHYLPEAADELAGMHLRDIGLAQPQMLNSTVRPDFNRQVQALERAGSLDALLPRAEDAEAIRAAARIHSRLAELKTVPDRVARAGLVLGSSGGAVSEALTGAILAHRYNLSGTGAEDPIFNLLLGGAVGTVAGRAAPYVYTVGRGVLANARPVAEYAGRVKPGLFGQVTPGVAGSLAVGSPDLPDYLMPR